MDLKSFFKELSINEREQLAKRAGTKWVYVSQIIRGHRKPSTDLAQKLHRASNGRIALHALRPDVWAA